MPKNAYNIIYERNDVSMKIVPMNNFFEDVFDDTDVEILICYL